MARQEFRQSHTRLRHLLFQHVEVVSSRAGRCRRRWLTRLGEHGGTDRRTDDSCAGRSGMEEVVVGAGTWLEDRHQVNLLDAEFVRGASRTRVEERHQARQHLTRLVDRDRLSPRLSDSPVPHHRRFFLSAAFVKPRLTNDDDAIGMRLCSFYRAAKVPFEMIQHWGVVGHALPSLSLWRAHPPPPADPPARTGVDLHWTQPTL